MELNFAIMREVNVARCIEGWKHPLDSWTLDEWLIAVAGEMGEALNVVKKLNRARDGITGNDRTVEELRGMLADELADTAIYLDLLLAAADGGPLSETRFLTATSMPCSAEVAELVEAVGTLASAVSLSPFATEIEAKKEAAEEVLDRLFIVAGLYDINLIAAIVSKFNRTSEKHGMTHRLPVDDHPDVKAQRAIEGEPEEAV